MRFGNAQVHKREAKWLEEELKRFRVKLFIANPEAGEDIFLHVLKRMETAEAMIVMGTRDYGEGEIFGGGGRVCCSYLWKRAALRVATTGTTACM